ncbi:pyridoxamine 5'-phosphate oxidase family protein [Chloroflexota bacterium]
MKDVASDKLSKVVLNYLQGHCTMTVATTQVSIPWAASVFYANDGFTLYFLSNPNDQHSENISENPAVAVTVNEDYHDWRKIKGIQMDGKAELLSTEDEIAKATTAYAAKYPFTSAYLKLMSSPFPKLVKFLDKFLNQLPSVPSFTTTVSHQFYKVVPGKIRFIDNERSFGYHEEFVL